MKIFVLSLIFLIHHSESKCQFLFPIKEHFDAIDWTLMGNPELPKYDPIVLANPPYNILVVDICQRASAVLGETANRVLEAYLRMYKTTRDQAYLIKFIKHAIGIQEFRGSLCVALGAGTYFFGEQGYRNGFVIAAMAHFVYLVKYENSTYGLLNKDLPQMAGTKIISNNFGLTWNTYGNFANWLRDRIWETLNYYTVNYWNGDSKCFVESPILTPPFDPLQEGHILNFQSPWLMAMYYYGIAENHSDYISKCHAMALKFKGSTLLENNCTCIYPDPSNTNNCMIFEYNAIHDSYNWKYHGWGGFDCTSPDNADYEDLSHGWATLSGPMAIAKKLINPATNDFYFNDTDLRRFRNMVAFQTSYLTTGSNCPNFHSQNNGGDLADYEDNFDGPNNPTIKQIIFSYMPFYKYESDVESNRVYNLLMNHYNCFFGCSNQIPTNIVGLNSGTAYVGLADMVEAQWEKECVNLTMYNRKLTYSQDFKVKNKLTIAPMQPDIFHPIGMFPFADPVSHIENTFEIEPNVIANMEAGEDITLKDGFWAKEGCNFKASIVPSACTNGFKWGNSNSMENRGLAQSKVIIQPTEIKPSFKENEIWNSISIHPNPTQGLLQVNILKETDGATLQVFNALGELIISKPFSGKQASIDLSGFRKGIFLVQVTSFTERLNKRVVVL